jgi:hypothetical protein
MHVKRWTDDKNFILNKFGNLTESTASLMKAKYFLVFEKSWDSVSARRPTPPTKAFRRYKFLFLFHCRDQIFVHSEFKTSEYKNQQAKEFNHTPSVRIGDNTWD